MGFETKLISDEMNPVLQSDGRIVRTYRRQLLCKNDTLLTLLEVLQQLGVAQGDTHPDDPLATLRSCPVKRKLTTESFPVWDVNLEWSTDCPQVTSQNADDPTQVRVKRNWSTIEEQRYIIQDRLGVLIVNSAGDPPKDGIPVTVELPVLVYERNESDFSSAVAKRWNGSLNQSSFAGCAPETLKLRVTADEVWEAKQHFWRVKYEMINDDDGWQPRWLNAGTRELIDGRLVPIIGDLTSGGQPITDPIPLYDSTGPFPGQAIPPAFLPGSAVFNTVDQRRKREFQELGLSEF